MNKIIIINVLFLLLCFQSAQAELHDPTRPTNYIDKETEETVSTALEVGLTLVSSDRKIVIINGQPFKVGEKIGNNRIMFIDSNSVQLVGPSGNITLFLLSKSVKQAVKKNL